MFAIKTVIKIYKIKYFCSFVRRTVYLWQIVSIIWFYFIFFYCTEPLTLEKEEDLEGDDGKEDVYDSDYVMLIMVVGVVVLVLMFVMMLK